MSYSGYGDQQQGGYGGGNEGYGGRGDYGGQSGGGRGEYAGRGDYGGQSGGRGEYAGRGDYGGQGGYGEQGGQGGQGRQGGQGGDSYGDQQYRGNYGASAPNFSDAVGHAENHGGSSSSYFSQAANFLQQQHGNIANEDIDQDHVVNAHQKLYGGNGGSNGPTSSNEVGAGAALQALKKFTGGAGGSGGGGQNQLIGLAMAEAEKLFDQQSANGNAVSTTATVFRLTGMIANSIVIDSLVTSNLPSIRLLRWL